MKRRFLVSIAFVLSVDEDGEMGSEDALEHFLNDNGYVYFHADPLYDNTSIVNEVYKSIHETALAIQPIQP